MDEYLEALREGIRDSVHIGPIVDRKPDTQKVVVETKATGDREFPYETIVEDPNTGRTYSIRYRTPSGALLGHQGTVHSIHGGRIEFAEPRNRLRLVVNNEA